MQLEKFVNVENKLKSNFQGTINTSKRGSIGDTKDGNCKKFDS